MNVRETLDARYRTKRFAVATSELNRKAILARDRAVTEVLMPREPGSD